MIPPTSGECSELLQDHAFSPRNNRSLQRTDGRASLNDALHGCAVRIAIQVSDGLLHDVVFHAFGDLALVGCASWMTECARTLPFNSVMEWSVAELAPPLGLPASHHWCLQLVIDCLRAAVMDYRRSLWGATHTPAPPSRHRNRRRAEATDAGRQERLYVVGVLTNLLLYTEIGISARNAHEDATSSKEREDLLCDRISIREILPTLPRPLQRVVSLVGLQGLTLRQAGDELGLSHVAVYKRLQRAAAMIQRQWATRRHA